MQGDNRSMSSYPGFEPPIPQTPEITKPRGLAHPIHTLLLVALLLANSWYGGIKSNQHELEHGGTASYIVTAGLEAVIVGFVWLGLRLRKVPFSEVIGGRWKSFDDFGIDIGIAAMFWLGSAVVLALLQFALGMMNKQGVSEKLGKLQPLAPHSVKELFFFLVLAVMAGICEEIVFRGYLQKQFTAWFRNLPAGIIVSAVLFGAAHGYQGTKLMLILSVYGAMFGIMAALRKSIIPGMMAHAWQDSLAGVMLWFIARHPDFFPIK